MQPAQLRNQKVTTPDAIAGFSPVNRWHGRLPGVNVGRLAGRLVRRQHDGTHTRGPKLTVFAEWANEKFEESQVDEWRARRARACRCQNPNARCARHRNRRRRSASVVGRLLKAARR
jgi:hypothetical protein